MLGLALFGNHITNLTLSPHAIIFLAIVLFDFYYYKVFNSKPPNLFAVAMFAAAKLKLLTMAWRSKRKL